MKYIVENFKEFLDLASINQGPEGWSVYSANPKKEQKKKINRRPHRLDRLNLKKKDEDLSNHNPN
jgi:hypothetical protein